MITITTSDMVKHEDNCFKLTSDNIFGPELTEIQRHPTDDNIFYGVGYHQDHVGGVSTMLIVEIQLHSSYLISITKVHTVDPRFSVEGYKKGWMSLNFDSTNSNLVLSGIFKDSSQVY